jgi:hypothetical protein
MLTQLCADCILVIGQHYKPAHPNKSENGPGRLLSFAAVLSNRAPACGSFHGGEHDGGAEARAGAGMVADAGRLSPPRLRLVRLFRHLGASPRRLLPDAEYVPHSRSSHCFLLPYVSSRSGRDGMR